MPHCRDCADSDGFCCNDQWGANCGFSPGHPLHRAAKYRTCPSCGADGRANARHDDGCPHSGVEIMSKSTMQVGPVTVNFTVGRIK